MFQSAGLLLVLLIMIGSFSCKKAITPTPSPANAALYFPPVAAPDWQTTTAISAGWKQAELDNLYPWLQSKNTKAFIILKEGKIVAEKYFGTFTADSVWYWASAGKTMTALLVGIAQQEGKLNISLPTKQYLGAGWTSAPAAKENLVTVRNQLTMTTGLDDGVADSDCTLAVCLKFKADAGTRWSYHNAPYTLLDKVVENVTGDNYNSFFRTRVRDRIGMNGGWIKTPENNNLLFTNARSMARFGLLLLNKGKWDNTPILTDTAYYNSIINTSQNLNLSYGYLTWLNGKASSMVPGFQTVFPRTIIPAAPVDLFAALGKNDQKIYVVPSKQLVVIRMGNAASDVQFALSGFDNELWERLKTIMNF